MERPPPDNPPARPHIHPPDRTTTANPRRTTHLPPACARVGTQRARRRHNTLQGVPPTNPSTTASLVQQCVVQRERASRSRRCTKARRGVMDPRKCCFACWPCKLETPPVVGKTYSYSSSKRCGRLREARLVLTKRGLECGAERELPTCTTSQYKDHAGLHNGRSRSPLRGAARLRGRRPSVPTSGAFDNSQGFVFRSECRVEIWPRAAKFEIARIWLNAGRSWLRSDSPNLVEPKPLLAEMRPSSARSDQTWRNQPNNDKNQATIRQNRPNLIEAGRSLADIVLNSGQGVAQIKSNSTAIAEIWSNQGQC